VSHFSVIPGSAVKEILDSSRHEVVKIVADAYLAHEQGKSVNPDSYFLRFPEKPNARIIALPAYLGGTVDMAGLKWISSFPDNVREGVPRASAVLVLNDYATGQPIACLEAAGISAARTAGSAAVAALELIGAQTSNRAAFIGAGVIARTIFDYLGAAGIRFSEVLVHDLDSPSAEHLTRHAAERAGVPVSKTSQQDALEADLVVFATTAATPYVPPTTLLRPGQVLLHISLRDLAPELLLANNNIVDDVEHCVKAQTSPHLAEQLTGNREFITGTLGGLLGGRVDLDPGRATIFSPFGLGILDIAVGSYVLREAQRRRIAIDIPDFVGEAVRW
jgi:2,3-diaminopropionate biosynthesis protein SbnB